MRDRAYRRSQRERSKKKLYRILHDFWNYDQESIERCMKWAESWPVWSRHNWQEGNPRKYYRGQWYEKTLDEHRSELDEKEWRKELKMEITEDAITR